jgi:hypothetical protein
MAEKLQTISTVRLMPKTDPNHDRLAQEQLAALRQLVDHPRIKEEKDELQADG